MSAVEGATWDAIGTHVHVLVTDPWTLDAAAAATRSVIESVDETYSRFRDDSELMALERRAGETVHVSPLLLQALEAGLRAARATEGASDPTLGHALRALGYDRDVARIGREGPLDVDRPLEIRVRHVPGWQAIVVDRARGTVRIPRGVGIDLGSTGKALAADLAAIAALQAMARARDPYRAAPQLGVLVNLGGDIATEGVAPSGGWRIRCGDDSREDPGLPGEVVAITSGAVATSSTTVRRWVAGAAERHHLLDPLTGLPTSGPWRTASVAAATCVDANAASTAAIVKGDAALDWLVTTDLPARLVGHDGRVVAVNGWPVAQQAAA